MAKVRMGLMIGIVAAAFGCSRNSIVVPQTHAPGMLQLTPLERSDYRIGPRIEGESCVRRVFLILRNPKAANVAIVTPDGVENAEISGGRTTRAAKRAALYDALQNVAPVDAVLSPTWTVDYRNFFFAQRACATVSARTLVLDAPNVNE